MGAEVMYGDIAGYIANFYGTCRLAECVCVKSRRPWLGTFCQNWQPTTAKTWEALTAKQIKEAAVD
jgi:hypothetical protein